MSIINNFAPNYTTVSYKVIECDGCHGMAAPVVESSPKRRRSGPASAPPGTGTSLAAGYNDDDEIDLYSELITDHSYASASEVFVCNNRGICVRFPDPELGDIHTACHSACECPPIRGQGNGQKKGNEPECAAVIATPRTVL